MAGMLTVVNPRRRRRRKTNRRRRAKVASHRRRRTHAFAFANPRRRRRAVARRRHHRRRRHTNPRGMGGIVGTLTKGLAIGAGAIGTNLAVNALNNAMGNKLEGPIKIAAKAAIGIIALPMILKFVPGGNKFANAVRIGAGVAVALDIFEQYVKPNLPATFQDYEYGALNDYQTGQLNGWMPQDGVSGVYDGGVYT